MQFPSTPCVLLTLLVTLTCAAYVQPSAAVVYHKQSPGETPANQRRVTAPVSHLELVYKDKGRLSLSVDGLGTVLPVGTVQVDKPPGGKVRKAFLMVASAGFSEHRQHEVSIDKAPVEWDLSVPSAVGSWNGIADVTNLVQPRIDGANAGRVVMEIHESPSDLIDGVILAVVFDNPSAGEDNEIALFFGAQKVQGEAFAIELSEAVGAGMGSGKRFELGVGISYSFQSSSEQGQFSWIDINGRRLTTAAGGPDDGSPLPGALLTVGGLDDVALNPALAHGPVANLMTDDEYYNLGPLLDAGDTRITVATGNPSGDENLFFASFLATSDPQEGRGPTAVQGGIPVQHEAGSRPELDVEESTVSDRHPDNVVLTATSSSSKVGSQSEINATVLGAGEPLAEVDIELKIVSGPHAGVVSQTRTNAYGQASFLYRGLYVGKDLLVAVVADSAGAVAGSSVLIHEWLEAASRAFIDIAPGVCPNVVNPDFQDLLTIALTGTDGFDVANVDVASLSLGDVAPVQIQYRDVSRPADSGDCPCSGDGGDGIEDLVLRFRMTDLPYLSEGTEDDSQRIALTGRLETGELFEATNCVILSRSLDRSIEMPNTVLVPTETIDQDDQP
ncbi:MAG: hypothetical protein V3V49_07735 [Candidatus Krumholzibacteria bacterium]